jgi:hypothetical protein
MRIVQDGNSVRAVYDPKPFDCDHSDGTGQHSFTDFDFQATLSGDTLTGETSACQFGAGNNPGIVRGEITLTISPDDSQITGDWVASQGQGTVTITRAPISLSVQAGPPDQLSPTDAAPTTTITVTGDRDGDPADGEKVKVQACIEIGSADTDGHTDDARNDRCDAGNRPVAHLAGPADGNPVTATTDTNGRIVLTYTPPHPAGDNQRFIASKDTIVASLVDDPNIKSDAPIIIRIQPTRER